MTENNVYECPDEERGSNDKLCLRVYENSGQFIYMPKMEDDSMETEVTFQHSTPVKSRFTIEILSLYQNQSTNGEPASLEETGTITEDVSNFYGVQHSLLYHGDEMEEPRETKVRHNSFTPLEHLHLKMEDQWEEQNSYGSSAMVKIQTNPNWHCFFLIHDKILIGTTGRQ